MPYPSEHACRLEDPKKYDRIRRQNDKFGKGVHAIWGVKSGSPVELQAIRFSKDKFTPAEARKWAKDHEYKCKTFEPASEKCSDCGEEMAYKRFLDDPENGEYRCENCITDGKQARYQCKCDNEKCTYVANWSKNCDGMKCLKCNQGTLRHKKGKKDETPLVKQFERWNKSLPEAFDQAMKDRPPASWEYDLYRKFLKCEIKDIFLHTFEIPSALIGTYLSAIKALTKDYKLHDTRRFTGDGAELPPRRDVIRLNSTKTDDFLIAGIQFFTTDKGTPLILKFTPYWNGMGVDIISESKQTESSKAFLETMKEWTKTNNFLKGERFALSGDFLEKSDEEMKDLIVDDETKTIIRKSISQVNGKGLEMGSRGLLFCGRPGTGKTKTGRIMMNSCKATFIWVSAKDFGYSSSGTISWAFSMAKQLAPAVLFIEDIDTWMGSHMVDVMKTEMDGLRQNKGILTILTSNNPELLPDALIDRPGRFHHVLDFKLPDSKQRATMLSAWIGEKGNPELIRAIADKTRGFSGAHLKELVDFAKIISEEDGVADINKALEESLNRLMKQKELIDQIRHNQKGYELPKLSLILKVGSEDKGTVVAYRLTQHCKNGEEWNLSEEIGKATTNDLKEMAVWYDEKNVDKKSSYKGIHHKAANAYPVHEKAVRNVAANLMNARGGIHIATGQLKQAREHIAHHYDDIGLGDTPWKRKEWVEFELAMEGGFLSEDKRLELGRKLFPDYAEFLKQDDTNDDWATTLDDESDNEDGNPGAGQADIGTPEDVSFKFVDGDEIRDQMDVDFTMGGHHYVYDFIPENEIWLDMRMNVDDKIATKMHEFFERQLMKFYGFEYNPAHDAANVVEKFTRHMTDTTDEDGGAHADDQHHWFQHYGDHHHTEGYTPGTVDHPWDDGRFGGAVAKMSEADRKALFTELKGAFEEIAKKFGLGVPQDRTQSGEPVPDTKKQVENPPEPARKTVLVVNTTDEERERKEKEKQKMQEIVKALGQQLDGMVERVTKTTVREELDRIRGKVPDRKPIVPSERKAD